MCRRADNGRMRTYARAAIVLLSLHAAAAAMQPLLDPQAVSEAVRLGQFRGERERARFHAPYRVDVARAPVDFIELITPFRRIVLEAQARAQAGDRTFGQRQAIDLLAAGPPVLTVIVELTFHPQHTFVGVPAYGVALVGRGAPPVQPRSIDRIPRHGPRVEGAPLPGAPGVPVLTDQPMLGGSMVASFDVQLLNATGRYDVVIDDAGKELARVSVDLGKLR